jgi:hypothetical protein
MINLSDSPPGLEKGIDEASRSSSLDAFNLRIQQLRSWTISSFNSVNRIAAQASLRSAPWRCPGGVPLQGVGGNPPAELEHGGMGAIGRSNLLQFIVGSGVVA